MQIGNFRGWEKPKTKARDELKQKISELEESFTLGALLEEAGHDVTHYNKVRECTQVVTLTIVDKNTKGSSIVQLTAVNQLSKMHFH